jgi:hypothetical protein
MLLLLGLDVKLRVPNPVLSTLRYFRNEYLSRLRLPDARPRAQTLPVVAP